MNAQALKKAQSWIALSECVRSCELALGSSPKDVGFLPEQVIPKGSCTVLGPSSASQHVLLPPERKSPGEKRSQPGAGGGQTSPIIPQPEEGEGEKVAPSSHLSHLRTKWTRFKKSFLGSDLILIPPVYLSLLAPLKMLNLYPYECVGEAAVRLRNSGVSGLRGQVNRGTWGLCLGVQPTRRPPGRKELTTHILL